MRRVFGVILGVLGILGGVLAIIPTGAFHQLSGIGINSSHLVADSLLGVSILFLIVGLVLALRRGRNGEVLSPANKLPMEAIVMSAPLNAMPALPPAPWSADAETIR